MTKAKNRSVTRNFLGEEVFLGLNIQKIFPLLNEKIQMTSLIQKRSFNQMNNFEKLYLKKNRLTNIAPEHCFDITLAAEFETIINNDFIQLEAK